MRPKGEYPEGVAVVNDSPADCQSRRADRSIFNFIPTTTKAFILSCLDYANKFFLADLHFRNKIVVIFHADRNFQAMFCDADIVTWHNI